MADTMDRITKLLQPPKQSLAQQMGDWATATNQAFAAQGRGGRTYGDALNEVRANRIAEQSRLFDMVSKSKYLEIAEEDREWKKLEFAAKQGERRSRAMWDTLDPILKDASPQARVQMIRHAMESTNRLHADGVVDENAYRQAALDASQFFRAKPPSRAPSYGHIRSAGGGLYDLSRGDWVPGASPEEVGVQKQYAPTEYQKLLDDLESSLDEGKLGRASDIRRKLNAMDHKGYKPAAMQSKGAYVDEATGEYLGEGIFDPNSGEMMLKGKAGATTPMPPNARPITESGLSANTIKGNDWIKLTRAVRDDERAITALNRYMENVGKAEEGWRLIADQFIGEMKTVLGNGDELTDTEFATLVQAGELQGLLGGFREEVVGGGVMTEQDALRVINRLGGGVTATRNRDVVAQLLREVMQEKLDTYDLNRRHYNAQLKATPRGKGFQPKDPIDVDMSIFDTRLRPSGLQAGTTYYDEEEGMMYEYLGGDPDNPDSWYPVQ